MNEKEFVAICLLPNYRLLRENNVLLFWLIKHGITNEAIFVGLIKLQLVIQVFLKLKI